MIDLCCGRGGWSKGFIAAGVPAVFPPELYKITKGLEQGQRYAKQSEGERLRLRNRSKYQRASQVAEIPFDLAFYVGQVSKFHALPGRAKGGGAAGSLSSVASL